NQGIVKKSGAWFTYGEDRFQGREGFRQKLIELKDVRDKLELEIREKLGMLKQKYTENAERERTEAPKGKKAAK
ncbi:DNA recombination/repair protein RecA, partial [Bacteroidota bacterium]